MKTRVLQIVFVGVFFLIIGGLTSQIKAQQTNANNTIEEIKITKADTFKEVRAYIANNFNHANVDSEAGVYNANVKFNIDKNGQLKNIKSNGDCKYVDKELENTLKEMLGKVKAEGFSDLTYATTFVMPVKIVLEP